MKMISLLLVG